MKRIVQSGMESWQDHRGDLDTCPHCETKRDIERWFIHAHILVIHPRYSKSGSVVIISKCPACSEDSWIHWACNASSYIEEFPNKWKIAIEKKAAVDRKLALRQWAIGLCGRCKHLEGGSVDFTTRRYCKSGSGSVETECDKFVAIKGGKK